MPGVLIGSLGDLLKSQLADFRKKTFEETQQFNNYFLTQLLFEEGREESDGGTQYETRIRLRASAGAQWRNLYGGVPALLPDLMGVLASPWANYIDRSQSYDDTEKEVNSGPEKLVDIMDERMSGSYEGIWNLIEQACARSPSVKTPDANNPVELRGLEYHFAPCLTSANAPYTDPVGGFNGQCIRYLSGEFDTVIENQDRSDPLNTRLRNWNFTHGGTWDSFFSTQMRKAMEWTNFETIKKLKGTKGGSGKGSGRRVIVVGIDMGNDYEDLVNAGPDDRDGDANPFYTNLKFRGVGVFKCRVLDDRPNKPVYGLFTKHLQGRVLKGRWMRPMDPVQNPNAPNVYDIPVDGTALIHCDNPREGGFVGTTVLS